LSWVKTKWAGAAAVRMTAEVIAGGRYTLVEGSGQYPMKKLAGFPSPRHGRLSDLGVPR
jgi:hypothetical protein